MRRSLHGQCLLNAQEGETPLSRVLYWAPSLLPPEAVTPGPLPDLGGSTEGGEQNAPACHPPLLPASPPFPLEIPFQFQGAGGSVTAKAGGGTLLQLPSLEGC